MRQQLAVLNSDQLNSQRIITPLPVLCEALEQGWLPGVPMCLSHDAHRLVGWTRALGVHLEPNLARLTGLTEQPTDEGESRGLGAAYHSLLAQRLVAEVSPHRAELENRLASHLCGAQEEVDVGAAALVEKGLAARVFADVFAEADKDGLVRIPELTHVAPGVFERGGLLLFASDFFRRSLSRQNTLNEPFLAALLPLARDPNLRVRIRLDPDLVGLASTYKRPLEFAHWWGPKFNDDLVGIPRGITRHEADDRQRFFSGVSRSEFWWHEQNGHRTLECEELRDIPSFGIGADAFGCRYAHSMIAPDSNLPTHLDGAIRLYTEAAMIERVEKDMYRAGRHSHYVKLWRVDGPIEIHRWKELITHHFRDNELVGEYLGGVDDSGHVRPQVIVPAADGVATYLPTEMTAGMGVRVHVSYHQLPGLDLPRFSVVPLDTFTGDANSGMYVECDTHEVVKLLRRDGHDVEVPAGTLRLAFEDTVVNLGLLRHGGPAAPEDGGRSVAAIAELCKAWAAREDDRVVSFCLDVAHPQRLVRYSFAGHVSDLTRFFDRVGLQLPSALADVTAWVDRTYTATNELFPDAPRNAPPLAAMLRHTGILQLGRRWIDSALFRLGFDAAGGPPTVTFEIPRSREALCQLLDEGRISFALAHLIKASHCSGCGKDYAKCACSKYLDSVSQVVDEAPLLGLIWSARPANRRRRDRGGELPDSPTKSA